MMNTLLHELGTGHDKTVVMIHGTGMSWDMPHSAANLLAEHDHVILVSVPGHDPRTSEEFTSVEQTAEEAYGLIAASGMPIRPRDDEEYFKSKPKMAAMQAVMFAIAKTKLGELCATDHCRNAVTVMEWLNAAFEKLWAAHPEHPIPEWDAMPSWEQVHQIYDSAPKKSTQPSSDTGKKT